MSKTLHAVRLVGLISVLMFGLLAGHASAADPLTVSAWSKTIDKIGKKLLCVCHDGSELENYAGTIASAGFVSPPRAVAVTCDIPQFNDDAGSLEQTGSTACYTYTVLN